MYRLSRSALFLLFIATCSAYGRLGHYVLGEAIFRLVANTTLEWVEKMSYFAKFNNSWGLSSIEADNFKRRPALRWTAKYHEFNAADDPPKLCSGVQGWNETKGGNILKGIHRFTNLLVEGTGDAFSALMLIHLLQDLQAWHLTGKHRGGNDVTVTYRGRQVNLHRLWDTILVQELTDVAGGTDALITEIVRGANPRLCAASSVAMGTNEWDFMPGVVARADFIEKMNCRIVWRNNLREPDILVPVMKGLLVEAAAFSACHWDRLAAVVLKREKKEMGEEIAWKHDPGQLPLHAD